MVAVLGAAVLGRRLVGARARERLAEDGGDAAPVCTELLAQPLRQRLRRETVDDLKVEVARAQERPHPQRKLGDGRGALEEEVALREQQRVDQHVLALQVAAAPAALAKRVAHVELRLHAAQHAPLGAAEARLRPEAREDALQVVLVVGRHHEERVGVRGEVGLHKGEVGVRRHLPPHDLVGAAQVHAHHVRAAPAPRREELERGGADLGPHELLSELAQHIVRHLPRAAEAVVVVVVGAAVGGHGPLRRDNLDGARLQRPHPPPLRGGGA